MNLKSSKEIINNSQPLGQEGKQHRGHNARNGQRKAADSAGEGMELGGPGGTDDVAGSAESHTLGNGIADAQLQ